MRVIAIPAGLYCITFGFAGSYPITSKAKKIYLFQEVTEQLSQLLNRIAMTVL